MLIRNFSRDDHFRVLCGYKPSRNTEVGKPCPGRELLTSQISLLTLSEFKNQYVGKCELLCEKS